MAQTLGIGLVLLVLAGIIGSLADVIPSAAQGVQPSDQGQATLVSKMPEEGGEEYTIDLTEAQTIEVKSFNEFEAVPAEPVHGCTTSLLQPICASHFFRESLNWDEIPHVQCLSFSNVDRTLNIPIIGCVGDRRSLILLADMITSSKPRNYLYDEHKCYKFPAVASESFQGG